MITIVLNDAPYGTERSYNGLRLTLALAKTGEEVQVFLLADVVFCALGNQKTPEGYYNISRMIKYLNGQILSFFGKIFSTVALNNVIV